MLAMQKKAAGASRIQLTTKTALRISQSPPIALESPTERMTREQRQEAVERAEALSVVLAQPHRQGNRDTRLAEPLGRFCAGHRPKPLGDHCRLAGERYEEIIREARAAQGFIVPDTAKGLSDRGLLQCEGNCALSYCAANAEDCPRVRRELAVQRLKESNAVLSLTLRRLPAVIEYLVYYKQDPAETDRQYIVDGLVALADLYGFSARPFWKS